ncbi:hypothetical protein D3C75_1269810 [compost metagenome]
MVAWVIGATRFVLLSAKPVATTSTRFLLSSPQNWMVHLLSAVSLTASRSHTAVAMVTKALTLLATYNTSFLRLKA